MYESKSESDLMKAKKIFIDKLSSRGWNIDQTESPESTPRVISAEVPKFRDERSGESNYKPLWVDKPGLPDNLSPEEIDDDEPFLGFPPAVSAGFMNGHDELDLAFFLQSNHVSGLISSTKNWLQYVEF